MPPRKNSRQKLRQSGKKIVLMSLAAEEGKAPEWVQLLPKGWIKPNGISINIDEDSIKMILETFEKRTNDLVLDYEHQTLDGVEAPAAGWIIELEGREDGLWAKVEWTDRGREYVESREYRYISPVVLVDNETLQGIQLLSAALTNNPAIDGMQPVAAKESETGGDNMEFLTKLAELLGLSPEATEEEVLSAIQGMIHHEEEVPEELAEVLELEEGEMTIAEAKKKIYAMKAGSVSAGELAKVTLQVAEMRAEKTVEVAMSEGKIVPAQKAWAVKMATKDPKGFEEYLKTAPQVVPMTEISKGPVTRASATDETQKEINRTLGVSEEDFKKHGGNS